MSGAAGSRPARTGASGPRPAKASASRRSVGGGLRVGIPQAPPDEQGRFHLPDGSRSVRSPWVWRGMFLLALVALGFCLTLLAGGQDTFAALWAVITVGWMAISMWLWRQNVNYMR